MTNGSTAPRADAEWVVNFDRYGPRVRVRFSWIGKIAACVTAGGLTLLASSLEGDVGGTQLVDVTLPLAGTAGVLAGVAGYADINNPGGIKFVVMTSRAGADGIGTPVVLTYDKSMLSTVETIS